MSEFKMPRIVRGCGVIGPEARPGEPAVVCAVPESWQLVQGQFGKEPEAVHFVRSMEQSKLEQLEAELPRCETVFGIGGGSAIDTAKFIAWKRGCRLVSAPTIVSVDAFITNSVGVRVEGNVKYVGDVWPDVVAVDYEVIRQAPKRLNTAGCADILSIHTALHDWKLAADAGRAEFDGAAAEEAKRCMKSVVDSASHIAAVDETGIDTLVDCCCREVKLCIETGSSRPEEGSEHLFAYNHEQLTGRRVLHGELVGTGIYAMSVIQDNEPDTIRSVMEECGLVFRPPENGVAEKELRRTLLSLSEFVKRNECFYSVVDEVEITEDIASTIAAGLSAG